MWGFDQRERGRQEEISEQEATAWMDDLISAVHQAPRLARAEIGFEICSPAQRERHRRLALERLAESYERDTDATREARSHALASLAEWSD